MERKITIRLSDEEYDYLNKISKFVKMNKSSLIRFWIKQSILNYKNYVEKKMI